MNFKKIIYTICILLCHFSSNAYAIKSHGLTLKECYDLALKYHEALPLAEQAIIQARARYHQVIGNVLPSVSLNASETIQEKIPSLTTDFTRFSSPEIALGLQQPIFHGLIEYYAAKCYGHDIKQQQFLLREATRDLFTDVSTAFYTIAAVELELKTTREILSVLRAEAKTLSAWRVLGKIREADVIQQQAQTALYEANLERLLGAKETAYETLTFFTGLAPHPSIQVSKPDNTTLKPLSYYLEQVPNRPDILAAKEKINMSQQSINMAKGAYLPRLDAQANYYPYRVGFRKDISWDVMVQLEAPLVNFITPNKVKEAKSLSVQEKLNTNNLLKTAETEVKKSYEASRSSLKQYQSYQKASQLAQQSFQLQKEDSLSGLVNLLDVLQIQRSWFESLQQRNAAQVRLWQDLTSLKINSGIFP